MRIGIGLWWIKSVLHKEYPKFVKTGMISWTNSLLDNHPVPAFAGVIRRIINFQPAVFPYVIVAGEAAIGLGLTLGFLTPIAAIFAILLNLNYLTVAGVRPKDFSVNNCFRVEQGQNWVMILAELVIFFGGAWSVWSVDSALGLFSF